MSFQPAMPVSGDMMASVHFTDEGHAIEQSMRDDSEALIAQLDGMDNDHYPVRRKNRMRPVVCVLMVLLVAGVGLGAYFGAHKTGPSVSLPSKFLVPVPADLQSKCATASDGCRMACEPAECCDFPSNLQLSCLHGNEAKCLDYHAQCSILHGSQAPVVAEEAIPPAPSNLKTACTADKIASVDGFTECEEACKAAECCYRDNSTCTDDSCSAYSPCLILSASDYVHTAIEPHVKDQCSDLDTAFGRSSCRLACSNALCCFTDSCAQPSSEFCSQYSICNDLEKDVNIQSSATEINQICASDHTALCEVICERGACCFTPERCPTDEIKCEDYAECAVLYGESQDDDEPTNSDGADTSGSTTNGSDTGSSNSSTSESSGTSESAGSGTGSPDDDGIDQLVVFKADVDVACTGFNPGSLPAAEAACSKICADVGCCFESSGCSVPVNCDTYASCAAVYDSVVSSGGDGDTGGDDGGDDGASSSGGDGGSTSGGDDEGSDGAGSSTSGGDPAIYEACVSEETVQLPDQQSLCETMCEKYKCCFAANDCPVSSVDCNLGVDCGALWGAISSGSTSGSDQGSTAGTSGVDTTVGSSSVSSTGDNTSGGGSASETGDSAVFEACTNEEVIQLPDQPSLCETVCEKYKCCYAANDCPVSSGTDCSMGVGCDKLWGGTTGGTTSTTGSDLSNSSVNADVSGGDGSTGSSIYEACQDHTDELVQTPGQPTLCEKLCTPYECCFNVNSCEAPAATDCSLSVDCQVIYVIDDGDDADDGAGDDGVDPTQFSQADIDAACTGGGISSMCSTLCAPSSCCFASLSTCDSEFDCSKYSSCSKVFVRRHLREH